MNLTEKTIRFRICDIYIPQPSAVLAELYEMKQISGTVLDLTEASEGQTIYAVVQIENLRQPVLVDTNCIEIVE